MDAAQFLARHFADLRDDEVIEIRCVYEPKEERPVVQRYFTDPARAASFALNANAKGYHAYYGANPRKRAVVDDDGPRGKEAVARITHAWVDVDDIESRERAATLEHALDTFPLRPCTRVYTGGGLQALWALDHATIGEPRQAEEINDRLARHFDGDAHATDISRVLRIPGTINHKPKYPPGTRARAKEDTGLDHARADFLGLPELREPEPPPAPVAGGLHVASDCSPVDPAEFYDALAAIDPWSISYDEWLRVLMAIHAFDPSTEGLVYAVTWAKGKPGEVETKWRSFKKSGSNPATVFHFARLAGWRPPAPPVPAAPVPPSKQSPRPGPSIALIPLKEFFAEQDDGPRWLVDHLLNAGGTSLLVAKQKVGKCQKFDTPIVMHDGSIRPVQDIRVGDLLMGADSRPRRVLSLIQGHGPMYRIDQKNGMSYTVNGEHILALRNYRRESKRPPLIEVSVNDYLADPQLARHYGGYKAAIELPERTLPLDPYFLGLWLGDGSKNSSAITSPEPEIAEYLANYAAELGMHVTTWANPAGCPTMAICGTNAKGVPLPVVGKLRRLGVLGNKHIPEAYLTASKAQRRALLAGLLDTDGYRIPGKAFFELSQANEPLIRQIKRLADSLGLRTNLREKRTTWTHRGERKHGVAWVLHISGVTARFPLRVARKRIPELHTTRGKIATGITVTPVGDDAYYGFTLDGDGLYLFEDFTVTHNSTFAANLAVAVAAGLPFLGRATRRGKVHVYSLEVHRAFVRQQYQTLVGAYGLAEPPEILIHAATGIVVGAFDQIAEQVMKDRPALVVLDTLAKAVDTIKDGNDYLEVYQALRPVIALAESSGAHIVCVHHANKGLAEGADAVMGSVGYAASVDLTMLLRRDREADIRTLALEARFLPESDPLAFDFDTDRKLVLLGDRDKVLREGAERRLLAAAAAVPGMTAAELRAATGLPDGVAGPAIHKLTQTYRLAAEGSPKRYSLVSYFAGKAGDNVDGPQPSNYVPGQEAPGPRQAELEEGGTP